MPIRYVHLRTHSEYSLRDSTIRIPEKPEYGDPAKAKHANLVSRAVELGMPALALTDDSNLFAQIKFYRAAEKAGLKPIVGCDVWIANPEDAARPDRLTLLCRDRTGYLNLSRLVSRGWLEGQHAGRAQLQAGWLDDAVAGLFAIAGRDSACGRLAAAGREHDARAELDALRGSFGDGLYLELTRTGRDGEDAFNAQALQLAARLDLPAIASNDVRFLDADDFEAHEARVCIQQGYQLDDPRRPHEYSPEQWLKPADTMAELFADLPEALDNTVELAKRCNLELSFGTYHLPAFPVPNRHSLETWIGEQARAGLDERIAEAGLAPGQTREDYDARLERELDVIGKMGFAGYFLIVSDFIRWAKSQDIPVGPGRGSGAGSVVAWCLKITDLDPLRFGLLFERFLNPERVSMPDFDVDFCMERRDEVIAYVADKYGRDQVSQIITYGSMAAKAVLRDCGRVLGMPYGQVDKIAKLIPRMPLDLTLGDALGISEKSKKEPDRVVREFCELYQQDDEAHTLIDLALKLEGLARNAGKHAGGVVIAPSALTDFAPLYSEPGGAGVVTQYDKNDVEEVGLVKFDFLGLRTLTIIDWAVKAINARRAVARQHSPHPPLGHHGVSGHGRQPYPQAGEGKNVQPAAATTPLDIAQLPLDDAEVFKLFREARTVAVFQFEGGGMQRLLKDARPDRFEDLIALNSLFRPGPMELIPNYVARKLGREQVVYPDPRVEPILQETYGIMVYQEQVMQMAQIVGGYSLGGADLLRRAMGKKVPAEMAKHRGIFRDGAMQNGVPERKADAIFDQMEKFAGYGFNKSHAAAYSLVAYQTAWLKVHYPAEFMAATMSSDMDSTDKLVQFIEDARAIGLAMLPPDVNASDYHFVANADSDLTPETSRVGCIRYGLGAIKGVGRAVCEAVMHARAQGGRFRDLADFCARMDSGKLNKRVFEALIQSGAMDSLGSSRATLTAQLPEAVKAAEQGLRDREAGQNDMFGASLAPAATVALATPEQPPWTLERKLAGERATLGHYLSGHPTDPWREVLAQLATCPIGETAERYEPPAPRSGGDDDDNRWRRAPETSWAVAGMLVKMRRRGDTGAAVRIEDWSGAIEVNFFREAMQQYGALLQPDAILVIEGGLALDDFSGELALRARRAWTLDEACEAGARLLRIGVNGIDAGFVSTFKRALAGHCGGHTPLLLTGYHNASGSADLRLGSDWRVRVNTGLLRTLAEVPGVKSVQPSLSRPAAVSERP
ncbi:MAG: DNA polymerase III subunit alpha [Xanthomonadales bacterium]|nr:DNA polymerase III subunit alpha [Xanthomonadales bacterium]ODU94848.1 MAG: DNA polymerase III subunit alpha [Rhodanobacter sp. SCN 66-43]OJY82835.1 MAG: DNA polymerase III subunit alpha [Xanthomonadales bacterium 66-474]